MERWEWHLSLYLPTRISNGLYLVVKKIAVATASVIILVHFKTRPLLRSSFQAQCVSLLPLMIIPRITQRKRLGSLNNPHPRLPISTSCSLVPLHYHLLLHQHPHPHPPTSTSCPLVSFQPSPLPSPQATTKSHPPFHDLSPILYPPTPHSQLSSNQTYLEPLPILT